MEYDKFKKIIAIILKVPARGLVDDYPISPNLAEKIGYSISISSSTKKPVIFHISKKISLKKLYEIFVQLT